MKEAAVLGRRTVGLVDALDSDTKKGLSGCKNHASSMCTEYHAFGLEKDTHKMHNVYADLAYADVVVELKAELERLRDGLEDHA